MRSQRLQLRSEEEIASGPAVVQRLLAKTVADELEKPFLPVPQSEGEHSDNPVQRRFQAPRRNGLDQGFGIGRAAPAALGRMAGGLELRPQLRVIVDFSIVGDDKAAIARVHWLVAHFRQIDDRQPPVAKADARGHIEPDSAVVRAAVRDRGNHPLEDRQVYLTTDHPRNSAHA